MSTEFEQQVEDKKKDWGGLFVIAALALGGCVIHFFTAEPMLLNTGILLLLAFLLVSFSLYASVFFDAIIGLFKAIFTLSFKPIKDAFNYVDSVEWKKGRIWIIIPLFVGLFWLDTELIGYTDMDQYIYIGVGFCSALAIYLLTQSGYYEPNSDIIDYASNF